MALTVGGKTYKPTSYISSGALSGGRNSGGGSSSGGGSTATPTSQPVQSSTSGTTSSQQRTQNYAYSYYNPTTGKTVNPTPVPASPGTPATPASFEQRASTEQTFAEQGFYATMGANFDNPRGQPGTIGATPTAVSYQIPQEKKQEQTQQPTVRSTSGSFGRNVRTNQAGVSNTNTPGVLLAEKVENTAGVATRNFKEKVDVYFSQHPIQRATFGGSVQAVAGAAEIVTNPVSTGRATVNSAAYLYKNPGPAAVIAGSSALAAGAVVASEGALAPAYPSIAAGISAGITTAGVYLLGSSLKKGPEGGGELLASAPLIVGGASIGASASGFFFTPRAVDVFTTERMRITNDITEYKTSVNGVEPTSSALYGGVKSAENYGVTYQSRFNSLIGREPTTRFFETKTYGIVSGERDLSSGTARVDISGRAITRDIDSGVVIGSRSFDAKGVEFQYKDTRVTGVISDEKFGVSVLTGSRPGGVVNVPVSTVIYEGQPIRIYKPRNTVVQSRFFEESDVGSIGVVSSEGRIFSKSFSGYGKNTVIAGREQTVVFDVERFGNKELFFDKTVVDVPVTTGRVRTYGRSVKLVSEPAIPVPSGAYMEAYGKLTGVNIRPSRPSLSKESSVKVLDLDAAARRYGMMKRRTPEASSKQLSVFKARNEAELPGRVGQGLDYVQKSSVKSSFEVSTGLSSRVVPVVRSRGLSIPAVAAVQRSRSSSRSDYYSVYSSGVASVLVQDRKSGGFQVTDNKLITTPVVRERSIYVQSQRSSSRPVNPVSSLPVVPSSSVPPPVVPGLLLPPIGGGASRGYSKSTRGKRSDKYNPSITAGILGLSSSKGQKSAGYTGFEIRPLVVGRRKRK